MTFKKVITIFSLVLLSFRPVHAQMDPRIKALGAMALYGTVGGTLLGTASLAFGADGRSVAKGASLGLYAGILFGSYVVVSHAYKKHRSENPVPQDNYYPGVESPYENGAGGGSGYGDDPNSGYLWQPTQELYLQRLRELKPKFEWTLKNKKTPVEVFLPLLNLQF